MKSLSKFFATLIASALLCTAAPAAHAYVLSLSYPGSAVGGDTFDVSLNVDDSGGMTSLDITIGFDPAVFDYVAGSATLDAAFDFGFPDDSVPGQVSFSAFSFGGLNAGDTLLGHFSLQVIQPAQSGVSQFTLSVGPNVDPVSYVTGELTADFDPGQGITIRSTTPNPAPEPATLALLGLACCAGYGASRKARARR